MSDRVEERIRVAITGVGGAIGQSIVKALQDNPYRTKDTHYYTIGIDEYPLGTGLYATDMAYLGYSAEDPRFIDKIIEICKKEGCKILFSGLDKELRVISTNVDKLKGYGITPVISSTEVVDIADDKLKTAKFLEDNDFPYPETYNLLDYDYRLDYPVILKPRKGGARSVGVYVIRSDEELDRQICSMDEANYVVQEYVEGDEYTCGTVSLGNGCVGVILMKRELRFGDTYRAFVVENEGLTSFVERVINKLKPFGACNVQLRVGKDGMAYIFEFNARCSGTTAARAIAGFNEPRMIVDYLTKGIDKPKFQIRPITILRYWKELPVSNYKVEELKEKGYTHNRNVLL